MKTSSNSMHKIILAGMAALFVLTGAANNLWAHDGQWDSRHHYYRDNYGYWDEQDHYHHYIIYGGHHGYWDTRGPVRVFINVD
ncbi:MAG: hypothetical protein LV481_01445 [Methylacidiphilales bacterium]|nr:hypothetical protein [Candidatus Methylacidiphilales bacterium]